MWETDLGLTNITQHVMPRTFSVEKVADFLISLQLLQLRYYCLFLMNKQ